MEADDNLSNLVETVEDEVAGLIGRIESLHLNGDAPQTAVVLIAGRLLALTCLDPIDTLKRAMSAWAEMMEPGVLGTRGN